MIFNDFKGKPDDRRQKLINGQELLTAFRSI